MARITTDPVRIQGVRMFGRDTPVYATEGGTPYLGFKNKRSGVYAFVSKNDVEFGSTGCLQTRFDQRYPSTRWATHVIWMELQCHRWLDREYRLYIEARCINSCANTNFLQRRARNYQFAKSMGRFTGVDYAVGDLATKFLHIIKRSARSIEAGFNIAK